MMFAKQKLLQKKWGGMVLLAIGLTVGLTAAGGPPDYQPGQPGRPGQSRSLTFEDRVWAQTQIERVWYEHRLWPKENGAKPPFEALITRAQIEAKVTDALKKSAALDQFWQRTITGVQLQAEMERMAKGTRDPATLREIFAALHQDPVLIAEALARPILADRLARNWYAIDERFHGAVRKRAEAARMTVGSGSLSHSTEGHFEKMVIVLREGKSAGPPAPPSTGERSELAFEAKDFARETQQSPDSDEPAILRETPEAFMWVRTTRKTSRRLELETLTFAKQPFAEWFTEQFREQGVIPPLTEATFLEGLSLPSIPESACVAPDSWLATSIGVNVPAARRWHTAVWTGSEMIIWGGDDGSSYLNTGGRYNPATDSWLATSIGANVPAVRYSHTAIWTGSEMIVWGGWNGVHPFSGLSLMVLNTGGRYNPATDSWLATSIGTNVPAGRKYHTAIWTGSEMIVWGGEDSGYNRLNTGGRYNPTTDTWLTTVIGANAPAARVFHTAIWTGSEMIVWGGEDSGYNRLNTGGRYNPATDSWLATSVGANVPAVRRGHTAVWTGSEMIVWGGISSAPLNTGGRYNPATDSWLATSIGANVPAARYAHTAVWTGSEMIVWGGLGGADLNTGGRYNPSTNPWLVTSMGANVPAVRRYHTAIWTGSEMIVWGGRVGSSSYLNTGGRYNPATDSWLPTSLDANVPAARDAHTAIWTGSEMIVWGGWSSSYLDTGGRYNPATDSWLATSRDANVPAVRRWHTAVWTGSEMIVWGGRNGVGSLNTGGRYNPSTDAWLATSMGADVPAARYAHTAVWTGSAMIVWGGTDGVSPLNTGGRYNLSADAWLATSMDANVPAVRYYHTAVWTGSEMIVWGGFGGADLNTGGRYNPTTDAWLPTSIGANVPAARESHTAIWTGIEMIIWGGSGGGYLNTGGRYNPATDAWIETSMSANVPAARTYHTAIWTGSEMIVWGGYDGSSFLNTGGRYAAPRAALAMSVILNSKVSLDVVQTWTPVVGAVSYNVYRNPSNNPATWGTALANGITGTSYSDTGQLGNTTSQFYSVTVMNSCGAESPK